MDKVLFICGHNSGRSQIAEAYLKAMGKDRFEVKSAGLSPAESIHPLVTEVMKEEGIDLAGQKPKAAFDFVKTGELFGYVITVCDKEADENCPIFPGIQRRENWPFPDPAKVMGTHQEQLAQVRTIRDLIKLKIVEYFKLPDFA